MCIVCSNTVAIATGPGTQGFSCLVPLSTPNPYTSSTSGTPGPCGHLCSKGFAPSILPDCILRADPQPLPFPSDQRPLQSPQGGLAGLRNLPLACLPPVHPTLSLFLTLPEPQNQPKRENYFCTLCNKIFMDPKGFFMCLPLIIEETMFTLSDKFSVEFEA